MSKFQHQNKLYTKCSISGVQSAGEKSLLLVECCFCHGNPSFNSTVHLAPFVIMLPKQLKTPRVKRTCSSYIICQNNPHTKLSPVSNLHIFTPLICYTKSCIVQKNVKAKFVSYESDVRRSMSKRLSVCLYTCMIHTVVLLQCFGGCSRPTQLVNVLI
jgi:hypothetical protein